MRIYWWLCNNSEIQLWLWRVWSLHVRSQSSLYVTRACKDDKNTKHAFSLLKKMLHDKQFFNKVPFQSTKYIKKELCVDNIKTIGDVYCPTCPKCVYVSTNKTTSFYDCKKCKACCHVLNIPLRTKNRQLCCLAGTGHIVYTSRDYQKDKPSPFFCANHNQPHTNLFQKRLKGVQIWNKRMRFLLAGDLSSIFNFQIILFIFNL